MTKKTLFKLSIAGILLFVLGGCSNNSEKKSAADTTNNLYGYDTPINLKVGYSYASDVTWKKGETPENNQWTKLYKKEGYNLKTLYSVDSSQGSQKLTTAIASGNYPDVFGVSSSDLVKYAKSGVISDLTEAYKKYASPELKKYMQYDGTDYLKSGEINGKLYGLPRVDFSYSNVMMLWVRQDWLDNLNLKAPTTMDELQKVATAFTKKDPDNNGKSDTYGLALNGKDDFSYWSGLQAFFEGYGIEPGTWTGNFPFTLQDGKIQWGGSNSQVMKKALTALNSMYKEGTLAKGFASIDMNSLLKEIASGKCGMYFAPNWGAMVPALSAFKNDSSAEFIALSIPDGNGKGSAKPFVNETPTSFKVSSSKSTNPEAVVKLANLSVQKLIYPKSKSDERYYGLGTNSGVGWKGSLIDFKDPSENLTSVTEIREVLSGKTQKLSSADQQSVSEINAYLIAKKNKTLKQEILADDSDVAQGLSNWTVWGDDGGSLIMKKYFDSKDVQLQEYRTAPTENMSNKYATLNPMTMETLVKIISGAEKVSYYDKFLQTWKSMGGNEVTKEAQQWYDKTTK